MKPRIAIIVVFLLLGAIVNVAVAWGIMAQGRSSTLADRGDRRPLTPAEERWSQANMLPDIAQGFPEATRGKPTAEELHRAGWRRIVITEEIIGQAGEVASMDGLPWRTTGVATASRVAWMECGLPLRSARIDFSRLINWAPELIPMMVQSRPIFPGFIINTLFYALLLWLLFFAPFAARRMLRRRRGLCEKCAYPIGVSPVCTECGAAVSTSLRRSAGV